MACAAGTATITVICFRPDPFTTRGEAMFAARLAKQNNWSHVIVVSWNHHMVRARYIFGQCFAGTVTMRPVPRSYDYSLALGGDLRLPVLRAGQGRRARLRFTAVSPAGGRRSSCAWTCASSTTRWSPPG